MQQKDQQIYCNIKININYSININTNINININCKINIMSTAVLSHHPAKSETEHFDLK